MQALTNSATSMTSVSKAKNHVSDDSSALFDKLPDVAFIREAQLVRSAKRPHAVAILPFSAPTLWRKVKAGQFPAPVKLGPQITAWNVGKVRAWMQSQQATEAE